jgi:hypothetical protein
MSQRPFDYSIPVYTLAERERRWNLARGFMTREDKQAPKNPDPHWGV